MALIEAHNVSKRFESNNGESVLALQGSSFEVEDGDFVTVVGPSGCGKTTLLMIAAGLESLTDGSLKIDGQNVTEPRRDTAVVFQKPVLLPWKSALENVLLPIRSLRKPTAADRQTAIDLLQAVGLDGFAGSYPNQLSGGMAQRNGLARALVTNPRILLMDEPFAAVDALTRERLMLHMARLWETQRKAALFITHNITEAVFLGDKVLVFSPRPGRIIKEIRIDFSRPRTVDLLGTPEFNKKAEEVRYLLEPTATEPQAT